MKDLRDTKGCHCLFVISWFLPAIARKEDTLQER